MLDVQGRLDKVDRRSNSNGTTESAAKGLAAFEQFVRQRHSTLRDVHPNNLHMDGLIAALWGQQLEKYKVLDGFAAYISRLTVILPDGTEASFKPHTVTNRVYAVVSLLRYQDIQVRGDFYKTISYSLVLS